MSEEGGTPVVLAGAPYAPQFSPQGQRLAYRTRALQEPEVDVLYLFAHGNLSEAMMRPFVQLGSIIDPPDPYAPWETLFNVDLCPEEFLPWLGQVVGVRMPTGLTGDQMRDFIRDLSFEEIGTTRAITAAVRAVLTPSDPAVPATVYFRERDNGDAYYLEIITLTAETPDQALVEAAIDSQLPAGIIVSHRTTLAWDYQQMTAEGGTYLVQKSTYATYSTLREHDPI